MPQSSTSRRKRAVSASLNRNLQLRQEVFITLCATHFGGDEKRLRKAIAKHLTMSWQHQGLARSVKNWCSNPPPVRVSKKYAAALCEVLEVKESYLFVVDPATSVGCAHFAYADELARVYGALCEKLPHAGLTVLTVREFDFLVTYTNWRAALVRSSQELLPASNRAKERVKGNLAGASLALRGDEFAKSLYRVLALLLADAKKAKPREGQWKALSGFLSQLTEALRPPEPPVATVRAVAQAEDADCAKREAELRRREKQSASHTMLERERRKLGATPRVARKRQ